MARRRDIIQLSTDQGECGCFRFGLNKSETTVAVHGSRHSTQIALESAG
jgi:hypothetical protein